MEVAPMLLITTRLSATARSAPLVGIAMLTESFAAGSAIGIVPLATPGAVLVATPLAVEVLAVMGALIWTVALVAGVASSVSQAFHRDHDRDTSARTHGRVHTGSPR
jgi:hypothetical protein